MRESSATYVCCITVDAYTAVVADMSANVTSWNIHEPSSAKDMLLMMMMMMMKCLCQFHFMSSCCLKLYFRHSRLFLITWQAHSGISRMQKSESTWRRRRGEVSCCVPTPTASTRSVWTGLYANYAPLIRLRHTALYKCVFNLIWLIWRLKPRSHRARRRASTNLHTSNGRCQFKLYIGYCYWTSNNNKWPKCSCRYKTPPDNTCANDVIDNDVTENDIIDSWMNTHTLYLQVGQMWSRRRARSERGFSL